MNGWHGSPELAKRPIQRTGCDITTDVTLCTKPLPREQERCRLVLEVLPCHANVGKVMVYVPCGRPRSAHKPAERPEPEDWRLKVYGPAAENMDAAHGAVARFVREPSPEAEPLSAPEVESGRIVDLEVEPSPKVKK